MRLLNTETLELVEFLDHPKEPYTILSHTWGDAEVSFQDFQLAKDATNNEETARLTSIITKAGYLKIQACCVQSKIHGYRWTWVDTCCIDKTNSVELSESINSMFKWYQNAAVCYIFLDDIEKTPEFEANPRDVLQSCRWFERGWTLQELIAPTRLFMFDAAWQLIGELNVGSPLLDAVSQTAGIPVSYLKEGFIYTASISMRMSWAAKRKTTRPEDMAYCLLGIFNVNMPLLYGEGGEKAFVRLQEEIIKTSHDHTIFAWERETESSTSLRELENIGILATSPAAFQHSGNLVPSIHNRYHKPSSFEMTNLGLRIRLAFRQGEEDDEFLGVLDCHQADIPDKRVALRFSSSTPILKSTNFSVNPSLWAFIELRKIKRWGRSKKDSHISEFSEICRDYNVHTISNDTTMYRRGGPLLFEDADRSLDTQKFSIWLGFFYIAGFLDELRSDAIPSYVIVNQPRTSRSPTRQIVFVFPNSLTWHMLDPLNPALKVLRDLSGNSSSLLIIDQEAQSTGRKDIYIGLRRQSEISEHRASSGLHRSDLVISFHWDSENQSYQLLMSSRPLTTSSMRQQTPQELYYDRKRRASTQLRYKKKQYSSLISSHEPSSIRVEIKETSFTRPPGYFSTSFYLMYSPLFALSLIPFICVALKGDYGGWIVLNYSVVLFLSSFFFQTTKSAH